MWDLKSSSSNIRRCYPCKDHLKFDHPPAAGSEVSNLNLKKIIFDIWNSTKDINELKTVFRCQARQFLDKGIVLKSEIPLVDLSCILALLPYYTAAPIYTFFKMIVHLIQTSSHERFEAAWGFFTL